MSSPPFQPTTTTVSPSPTPSPLTSPFHRLPSPPNSPTKSNQKSQQPLRSNLISISHTSIDSIIKQDFDKEKHFQGVYIYLLNLGSQSKPYAYKYTDTGESSLGVTNCSNSIWTGKDRFLWIDLSARPVDYGPALSDDGLLPRRRVSSFDSIAWSAKIPKAVLADMASLVWSAYKVLLLPSLRIPI